MSIIVIVGLIVIVLITSEDPPVEPPFSTRTYQHNDTVLITRETHQYVREYKKQLVKNVTALLNDLGIRFTISNGNLIEYERQQPILHDDDIDIRFYKNDLDKLWKYCQSLTIAEDERYNLKYNERIFDFEEQEHKGVQMWLLVPPSSEYVDVIDIHADVVCEQVYTNFWPNFNIDFLNLRDIVYLETLTYAPSSEDTKRILTRDYGENYLIPN